MKYSELYKYRAYIEKGATSLTDTDALDAVALFPAWAVGVYYEADTRIRYGEKLYKVVQAHTSQADWLPEDTPALYTEVAAPGQGDTPDNPIPYTGNMALEKDKYYSEDGSLIYCDFTGLTPVFSQSILEMIQMGGFDFSKSETDGEILAYLKQNDNDVEKTKEYLEKLWGEDYDANCELYQIDDIFDGRYHGKGTDLTDDIKAYVDKIEKAGSETEGCVVVDERLAEILQHLMNKYTFDDVEHSWLKLCYYYDHLGK